MAIQGFFTGDVKIRDLNGVLKAVDGIVEVATDAGTVTSVGLTVGSTGTDANVANSPVTTSGNITLNLPTASATNRGLLSSADWAIFDAKQGSITLTTIGSSGPATLTSGTLNIPNYTGALSGYVPYTGATTNVDLGEFELKAGQFTLDVSPTGTAAVGTTRWNNTIGSSETTLKGGTVILKNGVDLVARVVNKVFPNATLTKAAYQAVRVSGAQGQRLAVSYAQADGDPNSADTIGLVTETIATNQEGFIMTVGQLDGINTTGSLQGETWTDGDVLYLSPTIPGAITNIKPSAPQHLVVMGYVEYAHANNGKIYVKIMNGWELGELHDVNTTGAVNGSVLKYNGTIWVPSSDIDTGITSLNGLTALSQSFATGTSGTDFNISSATATHTFNLPTASATNRGALSTADWTTFNGKQAALNGTGFVKISGTTISYDNSTYLTTSAAASTYLPLVLSSSAYTVDINGQQFSIFGSAGGYTSGRIVVDPLFAAVGYQISGVFDGLRILTNGNAEFTNSGITRFFNQVRFDSTLSNGTYTYTLPSATGTLALVGGAGVGTVTSIATTGPITGGTITTTGTIGITQATTSTDGYLSSTDWNTFNNKQAAGSYITALTGEATASGPGSASVTLSTSAVTGKILTGLNLTGGGTIADTDSILQAFGKVQNQISGMVGGVTFQGVWNASTNTPTLTSSVGTKGYYYIVDVAGSTNLNGITDWKIGDWAIFNGTTWDKVDNTDAVSSVNGFTGAVSLTTSNISEGTNLYYLDSRARLALSFTAGSGAYDNTTGVITIPTNTSQLTNGANFITLSSLSASSPLAYNSGSGAFSIQVANGSQNGYLSSTDWTTFNSKQNAITLTTTGSSGSSTLVGATLNVPTYTLSGLGGVPTTRQLTINGTAYDLSADRSWSVGTLTGTLNTGYVPKATGATSLADSLIYDSGTAIGINTTSPHDSTQFKLDVNGGLIIKNVSGITAQLTLINSNPAVGGNNGFVQFTAGGNTATTFAQLQTYYGLAVAAGALRLQPLAGQVLIGTSTTSAFLTDINGTLRVSGQLTLGSTITDGTNTYTLPSSTGTLALVGGSGVGTVTSVAALTIGTSGTDLSSTVANSTTTPVITLNVPTASATNRGALSSADWTTFNNKQNALTNPVTGTGTTNYLSKFTGTSTIGNSQIFDNGTQLAINTASPSGFGTQRFLVVSSAASQVARFTDGTNGDLVFDFPTTTVSRITAQYGTGGNLVFANGTGFTERMRLDASGNLGLGVTPSAWNSGYKVMDVSAWGSIAGEFGTQGTISLVSNCFANSTGYNNWTYVNTAPATRYKQYNGEHQWHIAPSGTAGNTISFTQAMTLDASGRLGVGVTSPTTFLDINSGTNPPIIKLTSSAVGQIPFSIRANIPGFSNAGFSIYDETAAASRLVISSTGNVGIGTTSPSAILDVVGSTGIRVNEDGAGTKVISIRSNFAGVDPAINVSTNNALLLQTNNTERMRITSGGNVGIGLTNPDSKLVVSGSGNITTKVISSDNQANVFLQGTFGQFENLAGDLFITNNAASSSMIFRVGSATERMRITSGGNMLVGTTVNYSRLTVSNGNSTRSGITISDANTASLMMFAGANSDAVIAIDTNNLVFKTGATVGQDNGSERMRITSGGEVYIAGTTDQGAYNLQVNGTGVWGAGAYVNGSDRSLKENIYDLDECLELIKQLKPVTYKYKESYSKDNSTQTGFIAQDLKELFKNKSYLNGLVKEGSQHLSVAYQNLIPILVKGIQELKAELDTLKNK